MFDQTYRCPIGSPNPQTCTCSSCHLKNEMAKSQAALRAAEARNLAPIGRRFSSVNAVSEPEPRKSLTNVFHAKNDLIFIFKLNYFPTFNCPSVITNVEELHFLCNLNIIQLLHFLQIKGVLAIYLSQK